MNRVAAGGFLGSNSQTTSKREKNPLCKRPVLRSQTSSSRTITNVCNSVESPTTFLILMNCMQQIQCVIDCDNYIE